MDIPYTNFTQSNNNEFNKISNLFPSDNKEIIQNSFDNSFEEELASEWRITTRDDINKRNTYIYNDYKICSFNFFINSSKSNKEQDNINQEKNKNNKNSYKKRGRRKKKENEDIEKSEQKIHTKFSDDNMRKKCKNIVLKYALKSINEKIKEKYKNNIGHGKFKKELKILNQKNKVKSTVDVDKSLLDKTLKEIFSDNISNKSYNFPKNHNKTIIESLINEEDEEKRKYFNNLFNITFIEFLNYFIGNETCTINNINLLNGFKDFSSIKEKLIQNQGEEYVNMMIFYLQNFKELINKKRPRKTIKKSKEKENE